VWAAIDAAVGANGDPDTTRRAHRGALTASHTAHRLPRVDADAVEIRVLGCLIEKQRTTPDVYPLSLNALRLACNQSTNRDPVVDYDEATIRSALDRLARKGWTRLASGPGSRAAKFRHLLDEALELTPSEIALLAVLMLRGPQTIGELRTRSERLYPFSSLEDVERALAALGNRELIERQARRPGQKEERYRQLLGGDDAKTEAVAMPSEARAEPAPAEPAADDGRLAELEQRVDRMAETLEWMRGEVVALRDELRGR
jgi:uncharacterized protein